MKRFLILFLSLFIFSEAAFSEDYGALYQSTEPADFQLIHNIDPYQNEDYQKYAWSPFPLFRLSSDVHFKKQTVPAGYYILTPRTLNGRDYVFFKEAGQVKYIIPVAKKELVPVDFYHNNLPKPKYTKWQSFCNKTRDGFYSIFRNSSRKAPPPSSYIVTEIIDSGYYLIVLYYSEHKYYLVFKSTKD